MEEILEKLLAHANKESESEISLFDEEKTFSLQVVLHKILGLKNEKQVFCKLPNPIKNAKNIEACLFVKDVDKKSRDHEKTIRKYQKIIVDKNLDSIIKQIIPMRQYKLEYRPFEAKRKLSTSFNLFLADKSLHNILHHGSKLGKEFRKKHKMPFAIDLNKPNVAEKINDMLSSTVIRLQGDGPLIDIPAFNQTHTVEQAMENIKCIQEKLIDCLPKTEANIKIIYLKYQNLSIPIYCDKSFEYK